MRPAARALGALALGTGLASFYVLPAWYEQRWVEITRVVGPGMRVEDSFLFGHTGEAFHDQVLHTASLISVAVLGTGLLCIAVSWLLMRAGRAASARVERKGHSKQPPLILLYTVINVGLTTILLLQLPVSEPVWRVAPELRFLQFPWRWLLVGGLLATLAGATTAASLWQAWRGWRGRLDSPSSSRSILPANRFAAATAAMLLYAGAWCAGQLAEHRFAQFCDEEDNVRAQQALLTDHNSSSSPNADSPPGFEGTDEYTPAGADNGEIQQGLPQVRLLAAPNADEGDDSISPNPDWISPVWKDGATAAGSVRIERWRPEDKRLSITTSAATYAVLRLMDYPAWLVLVNGHPLASRLHREDGLLTIPLDPGTETVEVRWHATPDVYAGRSLSLVSLVLLGAFALGARQRRARILNDL